MNGKPRTTALALGAVLLLALPAFADQCIVVTRQQATAAAAHLKVGDTAWELCEPCGEKALKPLPVRKVEVQHSGITRRPDDYELAVSGESIDLAYVFVRATDGQGGFSNLAHLAGCETSDVSPALDAAGRPR
jgi:hypothetical protein